MKRYDTLNEREQLANALAEWKAAGFTDPGRASRWYRRVRRLARTCGLPLSTVLADLERDAAGILEENEG